MIVLWEVFLEGSKEWEGWGAVETVTIEESPRVGGAQMLPSAALGERVVRFASRLRPCDVKTLPKLPDPKKIRRGEVLGHFSGLPFFTRHLVRIRQLRSASVQSTPLSSSSLTFDW